MPEINSKNVSSLLLTIAIPTYNRAIFLDLCLTRIAEELNTLSADQRQQVKVYVSNNASTDQTADIIARHQTMNAGAFEVVHNIENIGGERNVAQCYTAANTPYVWVLGDDDVVLPNKLHLILDVLAEQDIDIVYLNGYSYSDQYLNRPKWKRIKRGTVVCSSALDFVQRTHVMLTFITSLVVRSGVNTKLVSQTVENSNLPQLAWVLQLIRDGKKFVLIRDQIYAAKAGNTGGYELIKVFGYHLQHITEAIFKDQTKVIRAIQNGTIVKFFPRLVMAVRNGQKEWADQNLGADLKLVFGRNWRYYVFLAPLIVWPKYLSLIYYYMIRLVGYLTGKLFI